MNQILIERPNILVVCGKNKRRSRSAEFIFKNDDRINIRSVGVSPNSNRKINEKDLLWANLVLVMEKNHKNKIKSTFSFLDLPIIENLDIPDIYEYMEEELIDILKDKINYHIESINLQ